MTALEQALGMPWWLALMLALYGGGMLWLVWKVWTAPFIDFEIVEESEAGFDERRKA